MMTKFIEKFQVLSALIDKFNLNEFVSVRHPFNKTKLYNLEECKFGLDRIKAGPPKV
jgi:hypothetical protein